MFESLKTIIGETGTEVSTLSLGKMQDEVSSLAGWAKKESSELPDQIVDQVRHHWKEDGLIVLGAAATYGGVRFAFLKKGIPWLGVGTELPGLLSGGLGDYRRLGTALERDMEINPAWRRAALDRLSEKGIAAPTFKLRWPTIPQDK